MCAAFESLDFSCCRNREHGGAIGTARGVRKHPAGWFVSLQQQRGREEAGVLPFGGAFGLRFSSSECLLKRFDCQSCDSRVIQMGV